MTDILSSYRISDKACPGNLLAGSIPGQARSGIQEFERMDESRWIPATSMPE